MHSYSRQPRVEFRKKPRAIESGLQQRIVGLWKNVAKAEYEKCLVSIPNGADVSFANRVRLKREGMRNGMTDLILFMPAPLCYQPFEVKRPKTMKWSEHSQRMVIADEGGKMSPDQREIAEMFSQLGRAVVKIDDEKQFMDWVKMNAREMLKIG